MDQAASLSSSVLETLLKTNRPPTDQERAIIRESMAPTNAKLKLIEAHITDTVAHIQALKLQVEQAESKLRRLREEEAAILETFADHRRVFSPFRNLPEDILREICLTCVEVDMPTLAYRRIPLPYVLAQISSTMRHIALTTPLIWASMKVEVCILYGRCNTGELVKVFSILARRASTWFQRAGGLALTVFFQDYSISYTEFEGFASDPSSILFDTLLSYSSRWKEIQFLSRGECVSQRMLRIAALTSADVPLLQSVSLLLDCSPDPVLNDCTLLTIPTLRHVKLETHAVRLFAVNWAALTSVTLRTNRGFDCGYCHSKSAMARILQQTKYLVFCDILVRDDSEQHYSSTINLSFLKTLIVSESTVGPAPSGTPSILDLITAPILEILHIRDGFLDLSPSDFLKRSPHIRELSLPYFDKDTSLMDTMGILRHCPSLTVLSLRPYNWDADICDANRFLQAFVKEGNVGVMCPRLQYFDFIGKVDFSLQTLRLFLRGKQGNTSMLNVLPWRKVVMDFRGIKAAETYRQMLDYVSKKKAAGLDVEAR